MTTRCNVCRSVTTAKIHAEVLLKDKTGVFSFIFSTAVYVHVIDIDYTKSLS